MSRLTRRTFLGSTAAAGAALAVQPLRAQGSSANEQVNVAIIGMGGRGGEILEQMNRQRGVRVVALCDADAERVERAGRDAPDAMKTQDVQRVLDNQDVDAVAITACNHWHCLAGVWACQADKHVYVEKPLGHNVWEGRQLVNAAKRYNRVVQIGTQQRSDPLQAELRQFLHEDKGLGEIQYVVATRYGVREPIGKRDQPLQPPGSVDYNQWLGPAAQEPIYRDNLHYDWHWDFNTGNGEMCNWGVHILDDVRNVPLLDAMELPRRVFAAGGRVVWRDAGDSPNVHFAYYDTGGVPVLLGLSNLPARPGRRRQRPLRYKGVESGYVVHCEGGFYAGGRGGGRAVDNTGDVIQRFEGTNERLAIHVRNFLDAVRAGDDSGLNSPVAMGHASTNWCHMANIAFQVGGPYKEQVAQGVADGHPGWEDLLRQMHDHLASHSVEMTSDQIKMSPVLELDAQAERFTGTGADQANAYLKREYRDGFAVPEVG